MMADKYFSMDEEEVGSFVNELHDQNEMNARIIKAGPKTLSSILKALFFHSPENGTHTESLRRRNFSPSSTSKA